MKLTNLVKSVESKVSKALLSAGTETLQVTAIELQALVKTERGTIQKLVARKAGNFVLASMYFRKGIESAEIVEHFKVEFERAIAATK